MIRIKKYVLAALVALTLVSGGLVAGSASNGDLAGPIAGSNSMKTFGREST
jgi:hypothetical protein